MKAINIEKLLEGEDKTSIELTHFFDPDTGWCTDFESPNNESISKIIYLGSCDVYGDMFAFYHKLGYIEIYKGHLNSGYYEDNV